jgi:hypothetical protein
MAKSLIVEEGENLIHIPLYYQAKKNKYGVLQYKILSDEEGKKLVEKKDESVDILNTKWISPTWKSNNTIVRSSTYYNPSDGTNRIDWSKYQDNVFRNCLREWDVVDGEGKPIPVNSDTIGSLPSIIASALLEKYDKSISIDEDEKKKS